MKFSNTFYLSTSFVLLVGCVSVTEESIPDDMNVDATGGDDSNPDGSSGGSVGTNTGGTSNATGGAASSGGGSATGGAASTGGAAATGGGTATGGSAATGGAAGTGGATGSCETCATTVVFEEIDFDTKATVGSCVTYDGATYLKTGAEIAYSEPQCPPDPAGRQAWCDMMKPEHQYMACP